MQQENIKISPIHNKCKCFHINTQTAKRQTAKFQVLPFAVRVNVVLNLSNVKNLYRYILSWLLGMSEFGIGTENSY